MNSLIIGMGIGQLYKNVLSNLGARVYTVDKDPTKQADFLSVYDAIKFLSKVDTVHICTPNWTHEAIAMQVAYYSKIVFVEKPGVQSEERLSRLHKSFPETRIMMVKNNMWRDNIVDMQQSAIKAKAIYLNWINFDRVPSPGSWFTTKDLAFGGVSRDLMPHLLSLLVSLFPDTYKSLDLISNGKCRQWKLTDLNDTQYGTINLEGIHNVDDLAWLEFSISDKFIKLMANWRTLDHEKRNIIFETDDDEVKYELGLCPEYAYENMIRDCYENLNNQQFWDNQYEIDSWIHKMIEEI